MTVKAARARTRDEIAAALAGLAGAGRSAGELALELAEIASALRVCPWLEGDLRIELATDGDGVALDCYSEQGAVRERALAAVSLCIALDELDVALQASQDRFSPLRMRHHKGKLIFAHGVVVATVPPPEIVVSSESLAPAISENPHEKTTLKQPAYALPDPLQSATRRRRTPDTSDDACEKSASDGTAAYDPAKYSTLGG